MGTSTFGKRITGSRPVGSRVLPGLIILAIILILLAGLSTARTYNTAYNTGIAWNWGGVEVQPSPGIFLCEGTYDPTLGTYTLNVLASVFPQLVADC